MNFCVAILILNVDEKEQHFHLTMLYRFQKGKTTTEMWEKKKEKICIVYGKGSVTD